MNIILFAALSDDSYIARTSGELVDWSSKEDKQFFRRHTKAIGTLIMGRKTYDTIGRSLPGRTTFILSRSKVSKTSKHTQPETVSLSTTRQVKDFMESRNITQLAVCGGNQVYSFFMMNDLINEMYITIEHAVSLESGLRLLDSTVRIQNFELMSSSMLAEHTSLHHFVKT